MKSDAERGKRNPVIPSQQKAEKNDTTGRMTEKNRKSDSFALQMSLQKNNRSWY